MAPASNPTKGRRLTRAAWPVRRQRRQNLRFVLALDLSALLRMCGCGCSMMGALEHG
jgi:hypothetical protein